ncbi:hypothetical protein RFI_05794 [Reticulomyxa filosa]|uniref:Paladin n=1 Tax=Reticulomyxa filosa TaxID=46433 RepID=X6P198_RETFI|nr:hypothetical protein RFI_05794 [Reticulomyxa filosa]|eukprot:ETO31327.1 hypothetical protein RFI_05794 [Reticulomyxa filosa]
MALSSEKKTDKENNPHKRLEPLKKLMDYGVVKIDHFENIYRIDPKLEGAPNFRQCYGFHIYGSGQPTVSALTKIIDALVYGKKEKSDEEEKSSKNKETEHNKSSRKVKKILWINMRSEPVIYVKNYSYAPRDPKNLSENIHFPSDLSIPEITWLQMELTEIIRRRTSANSNQFEYHQDTYALLPQDRKDQVHQVHIDKVEDDIMSLQEMYDRVSRSKDNVITLRRLTVNDERAPEPKSIDELVGMIKGVGFDTAIIFNCQMGKGRTTEGMIMACLIKKRMQHLIQDYQSRSAQNNSLWPDDVPTISTEEANDSKKYMNVQQTISNKTTTGTTTTKTTATATVTTTTTTTTTTATVSISSMTTMNSVTMRNGDFTIIRNLVKILTQTYHLNGQALKKELDDIIDRCQHLQNLRDCIYFTKLWFDFESKSETHSNSSGTAHETKRSAYWKKLSLNFLERYFVLICFNAYLHLQTAFDSNKQELFLKSTYSQWFQSCHDIIKCLGTYSDGPLSRFNWD